MEVFAGPTIQVFLNVIVAGNHIDPDTGTIAAVLSSHPATVPTINRTGQGRYTLTFSGLDPELQAGETPRVTVSGAIGGVAWTPYDIALIVLPSANETVDGDGPPLTLAELAARPRVVQNGSERIEEHSLADQIAFAKFQKQNENAAAVPGQPGWPIVQWRAIHERP